jgi:integrative and conjugative element protein (TIGR02256 family)
LIDRLLIRPSVRSAIAAHVRAAPKTETGGILIGRDAGEGVLEVTVATGPGPRAVRRQHFFLRDKVFLQRVLDREVARSDGAVEYIGEWHVHPALDAPPSFVDRRSLWRIARRPNYPTSRPVLLIVESANGERRLRAYEFAVKPKKSCRELRVIRELLDIDS